MIAPVFDYDVATATRTQVADGTYFDRLVAADGSAAVFRPHWDSASDTADALLWSVSAQTSRLVGQGAELIKQHDLPRWFAYLRGVTAHRGELCVASGTTTSSVGQEVLIGAVVVSADRSTLAFVDGASALVTYRPSTRTRAVVADGVLASPLLVSSDGGRVLYARGQASGVQVWLADIGGAATASIADNVNPLALVTTADLGTVLYGTTGNVLRRWTPGGGTSEVAASFDAVGRVRLSRDGSAALYFASFNTSSSSGELRRSRAGTTATLGANVSSVVALGNADFSRVAFMDSVAATGLGVLKLVVGDAAPVVIATDANTTTVNSGQTTDETLNRITTLAYSSPQLGQLVSSTGGAPEVLASAVPPAGWHKTPDGTGVVVVRSWDVASRRGALDVVRFSSPGASHPIAESVSLPVVISNRKVAYVARDGGGQPVLYLAELP